MIDSHKHQQELIKLLKSNRTNSEIKKLWQKYYDSLSESDKKIVWLQFNNPQFQKEVVTVRNSHLKLKERQRQLGAKIIQYTQNISENNEPITSASLKKVTGAIEENKARKSQKSTKKALKNISLPQFKKLRPVLKSMAIGTSVAIAIGFVLLFGFFNERFIAPFITPSKNISSTPIIYDSTAVISSDPKLIIPKINLEVPIVFDEQSIDEQAVQNALERGVVHYGNSALPGEQGNISIVGHSSNNLFNPGKYKFAFVLLRKLEPGDVFYIHHNSMRYTYRVYESLVVEPTNVSVLSAQDKPSIVTLITCDPPGTSDKRLVVHAEQVAPDPNSAVARTATTELQSTEIPGNSPSLWSRLTSWL